jgi:hypothetical protein
MKEYRNTMTINVFVKAESEEEANFLFQDMEIIFRNGDGSINDSDIIDEDVEEVID